MEFGKQQEDFTVWVDDVDLGGSVKEVKITVKRKTEDRRPGGSRGTLVGFHGIEELKAEFTFTTIAEKLYELLSGNQLGQHMLFARASFRDEFTGEVTSLVHECRGRCLNPDMGLEAKAGEQVEVKLEFALIFYRQEFGGKQRAYVDLQNNVVEFNGVNETDASNAALGR